MIINKSGIIRTIRSFQAAQTLSLKYGQTRALETHATQQVINPVKPAPKIKHDMVHFKLSTNVHPLGVTKNHDTIPNFWDDPSSHPVWSEAEVQAVKKTHFDPHSTADRIAFFAVKFARWAFDTFTLFKWGPLTEQKVLNRAIFLETVAGVPGMTAGMLRHLRSLRNMDRDHGWIHTLLEEAENERMHLLTFLKLRKPGPVFKLAVVGAQGIFMNIFFLTYLIHPPICHRFVGYLEEEAVKTYTDILHAIDHGDLSHWKTAPAPNLALEYWHLKPGSTMRDMILAVRADEANHRDVNHAFAQLRPDDNNPFIAAAADENYCAERGRAERLARAALEHRRVPDGAPSGSNPAHLGPRGPSAAPSKQETM